MRRVFAAKIASLRGKDSERAGMAGLLQDVGRPITLYLLDQFGKQVAHPLDPDVASTLMDGYHAEIGARAVRSWNLPTWLQNVVRFHHDSESDEQDREDTAVSHLADGLAAWALDRESVAPAGFRGLPVARELGLTKEDMDALLMAADGIVETSQVFE